MRISGFSSGFSGSHGQGRERRERFRKGHSLGQVVEGTLIRQETDRLAWVRVDGHELLAAIADPGPPGTLLSFRIIRLVPDIVLQHLSGTGASAPSLEALAKEYGQASERLASRVRQIDFSGAASLAERKDLFLERLEQDEELQGLLTAESHGQALINEQLAERGEGMFLSMPWLLPQAMNQEIFIHGNGQDPAMNAPQGTGLLDVTFSFSLPRLGHVRVRLLMKESLVRYRLFMEHPARGSMLDTLIRDLAADVESSQGPLLLECLGVSPLAPGPQSLLAAYMSPKQERLFSGLNRRV